MKLKVYIQPNSKKLSYVGLYDGVPKLKIPSPPVDNAANNEIIKIFAKLLDIPKSSVIISSGHTSRLKTLDIDIDKTVDEIIELLERL